MAVLIYTDLLQCLHNGAVHWVSQVLKQECDWPLAGQGRGHAATHKRHPEKQAEATGAAGEAGASLNNAKSGEQAAVANSWFSAGKTGHANMCC